MSACGSQNASFSPIRAKICASRLDAGRRASGDRRVAYQVTASCQSCSMVTSGRGVNSRAPAPRLHQFFRPEEEHGASGEDQVLPPVRRRHLAVEEPLAGLRPPEPTCSRSGAPDCPQLECTTASWCRAAGMPNASQAQLAKYVRCPSSTACCVGTPEKGGRHSYGLPSGSRSKTRFPRKRP